MTIETKARVRVEIEIDVGGDAWADEEPGLKRAFEEAKESALNRLERVLSGELLAHDRSSVRIVKVSSVNLRVTSREPEGS